ncbi:DUF3037 domain-containing protein [Ferruginibacter yonginensis]|uniref:DUF3037 domain-containing protein n=1 Tax=Ferruginibacter yonginensis TaxID=1310416 RepID=A0ABV8QSU5_9BACT
MQEKHLYEYAVIRLVPHVEREEFINVGVVLFCKQQQFLQTIFTNNYQRIQHFCSKIELEETISYFQAFQQICEGTAVNSPISQLPAINRFRWLTANRSTIIQTSKVHPGFCINAGETLQQLFEAYVTN